MTPCHPPPRPLVPIPVVHHVRPFDGGATPRSTDVDSGSDAVVDAALSNGGVPSVHGNDASTAQGANIRLGNYGRGCFVGWLDACGSFVYDGWFDLYGSVSVPDVDSGGVVEEY